MFSLQRGAGATACCLLEDMCGQTLVQSMAMSVADSYDILVRFMVPILMSLYVCFFVVSIW